ncbi:MAG TPA: phosphoglucosamine mutase, partial [Kineobactrum sp.]
VDIFANAAVGAAVAQVEAQLAGRGRVLLRPSGTEPLLRVMVEGEDACEVERLCQALAGDVATALAAG